MKNQRRLLGLITLGVAGIMILDCSTPRGWAIWMLYLLPIAAAHWLSGLLAPLFLAALSSLLVVVGFFLSAPLVPNEIAIFNRTVGSITFWAIAVMIAQRKAAEHVLRQERDLFDAIINSLPGIFCLQDESGRFLRWNRNLESVTGYTAAELAVRRPFDFFAESDKSLIAQRMAEVLETGRAETEVGFVGKSGHHTPYYLCAVRAQVFGRTCVIGMGIDISARKQAEEQLRLALDAAHMGIFDWDVLGNQITWSRWHEELWGYRSGEFPGTYDGFAQRVHPDDLAELQAAIDRCMQTHERYMREYRVLWPDGSVHWIAGVGEFEYGSDGRPVRMRGVVREITAQVRAERALRESEQRLQLFIAHAPAALAMFDRALRYLAVSRRWLTDYGLHDADVIGRSHYDIFPEIPGRWKEVHRRALAGEVVRADEDRFERADGSVQWLHWEVRPWHAADGAVGGIVIFTEDITQRKESEAALRESEARFRRLFEQANDGIFVLTADNCFLEANAASLAMVGYTRDELMRMNVADILVEHERPRLATEPAIMMAGRPHLAEWEHRRKDGSTFVAEVSAQRLSDDTYLAILRDLTERKRAAAALAESERRLRSILDSVHAFVGLLTPDGILLEANRAPLDRAGLRREEVVGKPFVDTYWWAYSPAIQEQLAQAIQRAGRGEVVRYDVPVRMLAGELITIDFGIVPLRDAHGVITGLVPSAVDITDRVHAEKNLRGSSERLARLSRQLIAVQETERRNLARELHDEIGQVLSAVKMNLNSLKDQRSASQPLEDSLAIVNRAISQVRSLSLDLRPAMLDDLGLVPALRWYLDQQSQRGNFTVRLLAETPAPRPPSDVAIVCYRVVQEAITNIMRHANARHVEVELHERAASLEITVRDDGGGFDVAAARAKAQAGASLGLLGMEERVHLVGGAFAIASAPGRGTEIRFSFPLELSSPPPADRVS